MKFYAHTDDDGGKWQPHATHLQNVAELAGRFGASCGLDDAAKSAGLLHDLGKYRKEFQEYLCHSRDAGTETHHAIYGAALAFRQAEQDHPHLLPAAFAVAGHHAGLPDVTDLRQRTWRERGIGPASACRGWQKCWNRNSANCGSIHLPRFSLPSLTKTNSHWSSPRG
ncbi:MAG: CRISPR-associated endonuclease Cas3'' [Verrucomicrobia bacterium]|nr:CRISPR-associated endonuclease Cas3'' [Verrucomicrobiota bacterium]